MTDDDRKSDFVQIPPEEFEMGALTDDWKLLSRDRREKPQHRVQIRKPFQMARYPVTQAMWRSVISTNPSCHHFDERYPVEQISWNDVQDFLKKVNASHIGHRQRLPAEAEWEYAARGGTTEDYYGTLQDIAWWKNQPVGMKLPNVWGLYDMLGNVYEWVEDWYDGEYYKVSPVVDPPGPPADPDPERTVRTGLRVVRGGCSEMDQWVAPVHARHGFKPYERKANVGFRCVRELVP
jgi:formylglycine-generating enzyme required for sulfatase activity